VRITSFLDAIACSPGGSVTWQLQLLQQKSFEHAKSNGRLRTMEMSRTNVVWLGLWMMKWAGLIESVLNHYHWCHDHVAYGW
jgi:hypothetical protein